MTTLKTDIILKPKGSKNTLTKEKKELIDIKNNIPDIAINEPKTIQNTELEKDVDKAALNLIKKLKFFQDRMHKENPIKAYSKKRLYYGIKEVRKRIKSNDIKVVVIAKDFVSFQGYSLLLNDELNDLINECENNSIELFYASTRSKISHSVKKPGSLSVVGITDYQGGEDLLKTLKEKYLLNMDDETTETTLQPDAGRQGTIFCIDVNEYMFEVNQKDVKKRIHFEIALSAVRDQMNHICLAADLRQMIGIVFFNTGKMNKDAQRLENIFVYRNILDYDDKGFMKALDADSVKQIDVLINDKEKRDEFIQDTLGGSGQCDYLQLLWLIKRTFRHDVNLQKQVCIVFTKSALLEDMDVVNLHKIKLDLLEIQSRFLWKHYLFDDEITDFWFENVDDLSESFSSESLLSTSIKRKNISLRPTTTLSLNFGDGISLAVGVYYLILPQTLEKGVFLDEKTNKQIKCKTFHVEKSPMEYDIKSLLLNENDDEDNGCKVDNSDEPDLKKTKIDNKNVLLAKTIAGNELTFKQKEFEQEKRIDTPGIFIIGFKPLNCLKTTHYMRPIQYIYPNEEAVNGSALMYKTLWRKCIDKGVYILARMTLKKHTPPKLVALIPQEGTTELRYEGFHVVQLPYADDKKSLKEKTEGYWEDPDNKLLNATEDFINKLTTDYSPTNFCNPVLQKHYWLLESLATDHDEYEGKEHDFDQIKPYWKSTNRGKKEADLISRLI